MYIEETIRNLQKNNMGAVLLDKKEDVLPYIKKLIPSGSAVACGGSVTAGECGIPDLFDSGNYTHYYRGMPDKTPEEVFALQSRADYYCTSSNAVIKSGVLYNVDGRGNRVACIANGPKKVIVIAGVNKIVKDREEAVYRVKTIAAPKNCVRLGYKTYCAVKGECESLTNKGAAMTDGCGSPDRICCEYLFTGFQKFKDRIFVILVNEKLGY